MVMKVLIISHTSLNTHNNMGKTLSTLFSSFDRSELCQLYIYPMMPDVDQCDSYYRVTDKDVLKGLLTLRVNGREIGAGEIRDSIGIPRITQPSGCCSGISCGRSHPGTAAN